MRAARGNEHKDTLAAIERVRMKMSVRSFVPMEGPSRARQKDNRFPLASVIVIPANGSRQGRSQMHVGDVAEKIEGSLGKRETQAPGVTVVAEFGNLDLHASFSLSR